MQFKKFLAPVVISAMFGLAACGDDSSSNPTPPPPVPGDPTTDPTVTDPQTPPVTGGGEQTPSTPTQGTTSALASAANVAYPTTLYGAWKPYHFVNLEDEAVYYPDLAAEFPDVFTAAYQPAGRIIWSTQTSGYYSKQCRNENTTVPNMKYRGCTVSEGIGYGMLITYFAGDTEAYNRLWNYSRGMRWYHDTQLTPWITYSFHYNKIDLSSATDADLDIATSLILMSFASGNQAYLQDALSIATAIWDYEVNKTNLLLYSGDTYTWTGPDPVYNLSYFSPVALRLFAMVDPAHDWTGVLNAMYDYIQLVQSKGTGVLPDWSNTAGEAVKPANGSADKTYWTFNKESVRIPWRIAWDYYWFQDPRAAAVLNTLNSFIVDKSAGDPNSAALGTNYSWNTAVGADIASAAVPTHWYGAWCLTGVAGNPTWLENCTTGFNALPMELTGSSYFPNILQMMFSQLLNGSYVKPF